MVRNLSSFEKDILRSEGSTSGLGRVGERLAANHLRRRGFRIVASNFKVPIGRNKRGARVSGEIDIIALDGDVLCFVEVKTRSHVGVSDPLDAVDPRKQRLVAKTAKAYRRLFGLEDVPCRFDAIGITFQQRTAPVIRHVREYWAE